MNRLEKIQKLNDENYIVSLEFRTNTGYDITSIDLEDEIYWLTEEAKMLKEIRKVMRFCHTDTFNKEEAVKEIQSILKC